MTALSEHVFVSLTEDTIQSPATSPTASAEKGSERLLALDGLRGVAALCVAVYHYQFFFVKGFRFFDWGWLNVDLFFLISGIVMSHVYEKRIREGSTTFTEFLSHRLARLWPMHVFAMLAMIALGIFHFFIALWIIQPSNIMDWNAPLYTFLLNLFFLQHIGLYTNSLQGHTWDGNAWSLSPEIVSNIVWFYLLSRKKLSSKLLVTVVLVCSVVQYNLTDSIGGLILNSNLIRCAITYAMGCLLYRHIIANPALPAPSLPWANVVGLGATSLIVLIIVDLACWNSPIFNHCDWILALFLFPTLTCGALQHGTVLNRILSSKTLVFLGSISYSVYLMHVIVGLLFIDIFGYFLKMEIEAPYAGGVYLVLTIFISTLTCLLVEVPARNALRNRLGPFLQKIVFEPR